MGQKIAYLEEIVYIILYFDFNKYIWKNFKPDSLMFNKKCDKFNAKLLASS